MSLSAVFASIRHNIKCVNVVRYSRAYASTAQQSETKARKPEITGTGTDAEHGESERSSFRTDESTGKFRNSGAQDEDRYEESIRNKILDASLPFVIELGWTKEAISAGAESVGYPGTAHGMFTKGGGDLVLYFQKVSNAKLVGFMEKFKEDKSNANVAPVEFVEEACKHRLEMTVPYIKKWPQALAVMSLPPNVPAALATLLTMVDDICYHAGDRSVDFNWYARRLAVAGVYKASELYLLQDSSPEHVETWKFLNRRLLEAVQLQDLLQKPESVGQGAKETISAAFITARNILGLSRV